MSDVLADRIERMERFVKRMNEVERDLTSPYVRPKDAATLILVDRDGRVPKVLLGKRHHGHKFMPGKFVFPGGRVDPADRHMPVARPLDPSTEAHLMKRLQRPSAARARAFALAAIRETFEETGLRVDLTGLLNVYTYPGAPVIIVYRARVLGGTLTTCTENDQLEWVSPEEIPWERLAFPSTRDALREWVAAHGVMPRG
jgi:8-oxo-dGTP pyrophosphatase MutT (NUDIX family)